MTTAKLHLMQVQLLLRLSDSVGSCSLRHLPLHNHQPLNQIKNQPMAKYVMFYLGLFEGGAAASNGGCDDCTDDLI